MSTHCKHKHLFYYITAALDNTVYSEEWRQCLETERDVMSKRYTPDSNPIYWKDKDSRFGHPYTVKVIIQGAGKQLKSSLHSLSKMSSIWMRLYNFRWISITAAQRLSASHLCLGGEERVCEYLHDHDFYDKHRFPHACTLSSAWADLEDSGSL